MRHSSLLAMLLLGLANSAGAQRAYDIRNLLASTDDFAFRVSIKTEAGTEVAIHEAELCLTNKCDLFELRGEDNLANLTALLDFALIYTLYASSYGDLGAPVLRGAPPPPVDFVLREAHRGPELLEMYGDHCRAGSEAERAACVMGDMVDKYDLVSYSVTYDQGFRVVYPNDAVIERIDVDRIENYMRKIEALVDGSR